MPRRGSVAAARHRDRVLARSSPRRARALVRAHPGGARVLIAGLDEVDFDLEVDGEQVRRQLARQIWEARGWATVVVTFQERKPAADWQPAKLALLRFRKVRDAWKRHAAITLGATDAVALADTLANWRASIEASQTGVHVDPDGDPDADL